MSKRERKNNSLSDENLSKASGGYGLSYVHNDDGTEEISIKMKNQKEAPDVRDNGAFQGLFLKNEEYSAPYSSANPGGINDPNYRPPASTL